MPWQQNYDPLHGPLSPIAAALPLVILLGLLSLRRVPAYAAALAGLAAALAVAIGIIGMPAPMAGRAALLGVAYGLLPIGWIVLNVIFLYRITDARGVFAALQRAITGITSDRRLQLLLIAFCFGAFFEGAAGFGTPVAVTGAMLIGLGFPPLEASALSLIADLLAHRPVLAHRGVLRLSWNARGVAGAAGGRTLVRDSAVSRLELSRAVARRHRRVGVLDDHARLVSASLARRASGSGRSGGTADPSLRSG